MESYERYNEVTVSNKYLFRLTNSDLQNELLLIETDGGNERVLSKTIISEEDMYLPKIAYYSKKLERVYLQTTNNDMYNESSTMIFNEVSLKDGVASITGQASNSTKYDNRQICTRLRKTHFDDKNGLLRLLETDTDTATVYTWKMDNLIFQSKLDIVD